MNTQREAGDTVRFNPEIRSIQEGEVFSIGRPMRRSIRSKASRQAFPREGVYFRRGKAYHGPFTTILDARYALHLVEFYAAPSGEPYTAAQWRKLASDLINAMPAPSTRKLSEPWYRGLNMLNGDRK